MTTTDELYFAVGNYGYPAGVMITASHNPAQYNGMKMCKAGAVALSSETGVQQIRDLALSADFATPAAPARQARATSPMPSSSTAFIYRCRQHQAIQDRHRRR